MTTTTVRMITMISGDDGADNAIKKSADEDDDAQDDKLLHYTTLHYTTLNTPLTLHHEESSSSSWGTFGTGREEVLSLLAQQLFAWKCLDLATQERSRSSSRTRLGGSAIFRPGSTREAPEPKNGPNSPLAI